uniref:DUF3050 domain-containing protein n=1 Tax=Candidatus Kentrum sp. TUN TaxID=2126343 RepID=A0A450ZRE1_9GAMM|nr:MAG: Protein of unknown function (DUF3050) [Candidatus Kentron sp. TUN]VFK59566.1 MAG: Protein of unknown function (DUF3050) [Candidatus Kentron sp. TUN]VFK68043.1 MAG: Protein of unknown function (DUF3050) [Candidatus Kentron sp. TUN]
MEKIELKQIEHFHQKLRHHPLYLRMDNLENIKIFMKYHVFAVWDFMSLLKSLQKRVSYLEIPWKQSSYDPEIVRLINEIVLGEESDVDAQGKANSHYGLYLQAMEEINADSFLVRGFVDNLEQLSLLPNPLGNIVSYHLDLALNGELHEVAAAFFYGRERLIPAMFSSILSNIEKHQLECPSLIYYFERHIEVDSTEHGPKAYQFLSHLCDTPEKADRALEVAYASLIKRRELWDFITAQIDDLARPRLRPMQHDSVLVKRP